MSAFVLWTLVLPRNLMIALMKTYRKLISPLYGEVCRYYPSCSAYALEASQYHGALWGIGLATWRVLRCNPFSRGGIDDPPNRLRPYFEVGPRGFIRPKQGG